jgi:DAACS family dicarboxylate/amino acid:cation (Na+ or H+) symporter
MESSAMHAANSAQKGMPLHTKILLGLAIGLVSGLVSNNLRGGTDTLNWVVFNVADPVGQVFLRMLFMVVVPLVFTSLALGVSGLGDMGRVGRIGGKAFLIFILTTGAAVVVGLTLANVFRPGDALDPLIRAELLETYSSLASDRIGAGDGNGFGINTFVNIVPRNPLAAASGGDMLGLIFFTIVFGIALTKLPAAVSAPVIKVLDGIGQAVSVMIGFAMKIAPIGVTGLIFSVTAQFGFSVLRSLSLYVIMVLAALAIHQFGVITLLARIFVGISPREFFKRTRSLIVTAFSTSSSNATLPTTIRTAQEEFGVPKEVAGFVLPLGATMNMNGTALFEGMTVLFLAQVFGVELSLPMQLVVVVMSVITAVGVAGVPGGSIPLLAMVLEIVGVPGTGIALILGVDRILDMSRTVPNVTGDLLTSLLVTKSEGMEFFAEGEAEGIEDSGLGEEPAAAVAGSAIG